MDPAYLQCLEKITLQRAGTHTSFFKWILTFKSEIQGTRVFYYKMFHCFSSTTLKYFFCKIPVLGKEEILGLLKCTFDFFTNPFQTFGHSGWPWDIKQSSFFTCKLFFDFIKLLLHYVHWSSFYPFPPPFFFYFLQA